CIFCPVSFDVEGERERPSGDVVEAVILLRGAAPASFVACEARELFTDERRVLLRVRFKQSFGESLLRLREIDDVCARRKLVRRRRALVHKAVRGGRTEWRTCNADFDA